MAKSSHCGAYRGDIWKENTPLRHKKKRTTLSSSLCIDGKGSSCRQACGLQYSYSAEMAPTGHASAQVPHSTQVAGSIL